MPETFAQYKEGGTYIFQMLFNTFFKILLTTRRDDSL